MFGCCGGSPGREARSREQRPTAGAAALEPRREPRLLQDLPDGVFTEVIEPLSMKDLCRLSQGCRALRDNTPLQEETIKVKQSNGPHSRNIFL